MSDKAMNTPDPDADTSPPSQPSTGVPDGWQLVPIEPTQWMKVQGGEGIESNSFLDLWRRVLAAAPRSP